MTLAPAGRDHFRVFTPYWRRWRTEPRRDVLAAPARGSRCRRRRLGAAAGAAELTRASATAPELPRGGEAAGRRRLDAWLEDGLARYDELRDDLAADATSRLSPYLHFGCVSPAEVGALARSSARAARSSCASSAGATSTTSCSPPGPSSRTRTCGPRAAGWRDDDEGFDAWRDGRTGYPLVDAGMRQLMREGFMHNRARLVAGSFLTKHLGIDWRRGADHFFHHLVDGDLANNTANWQWVAGTGADSRPNRMFNPSRQAERYDPDGAYARRYIPELGTPDYPEPIVAHEAAVARFRAAAA